MGKSMLVINGIEWRIEFVDPTDSNLKRTDGSTTVGCTNLNTQTIYLSDLLNGDFLKKVIRHELCHAFAFSYGISMTLDEEERLCDFIATYGIEIIELADMVYRLTRRVA